MMAINLLLVVNLYELGVFWIFSKCVPSRARGVCGGRTYLW